MSRGAPLRVSRALVWLLVALAAVLVSDLAVVRFGGLTGLGNLEILAQDFRQRGSIETRSGEEDRPTDVVLVFFDPESVAEWPYREPFPRAVLADLVEAMTDAGAAAVGIDVFLADTFPELNAIDNGDARLRAAIERAGNVVIVSGTEFDDGEPRLADPHPYFTDAGASVASADVPDAFERLNDVGLVTRDGDALAPGFALALWATAGGLDVDSLMAATQERGFVDLPGIPRSVASLPDAWIDGTARVDDAILPLPIDFVGPPSHLSAAGEGVEPTFPSFSASVVPTLALFTPEFFAGKIVLMGTSDHFYDRFRTPLSGYRDSGAEAAVGVSAEGAGDGMAGSAGAMPTQVEAGAGEDRAAYQWMYGVEIHANALQNILDGEYLIPVDRDATIGIMAVVALAIVGVVFWVGTGWGGFAAILIGVGVVGLAFWVWVDNAVMLPLVAPLFAGGVSYVGSSAWVAIVEGREKRFIQGAFGKYVSPDVVASISDNPDALQLGGQKRMLSILFSDLSGFTTLSERMDPQDLLAHLNEYLTEMTQVVMDEEGTLDKYIGDAIMAFWNAPADVPNHAERALRTAVLMQRKMDELNARWAEREDGGEALLVRIGVNTGEVVVGNVGGENRFDYSAIGDSVNLAARLEPANKSYDTLNMCSEFTLEHLDRDAFRLRELDLIAVKGKERPVRVFEVVELAGVDLGEAKEACLAAFDAGLAKYQAHDWAGAAAEFERAAKALPTDGPSRVYLERSRENEADPPPADWDFVVRRTVK